MASFVVFAVVFLAFYSLFLKLRRRRERLLALDAQRDQPKITVAKPQAARLSKGSGPPQYTCLIEGTQQQYKRGSPEYELISAAIQRM